VVSAEPRRMRWGRLAKLGPLVLALGLLAVAAPPASATLDYLIPGSHMCDGSGQAALGDGTSAQTDVIADVFRPAFAAVCPDAVQPSYDGTTDASAYDSLTKRTSDFGAGSVALSPDQKAIVENDLVRLQDERSNINQFPLYVDIMAVGYNLGCLHAPLRLSSTELSLIFSGVITKWNDSLLLRDNPGLASCPYSISMVDRVGASAATTIFKDFLSKRDPLWDYYKQPGHSQDWPPQANNFTCKASSEDGAAVCILSTANSIGYLQYHAARVNGIPMAAIDNIASEAGTDPNTRFIAPSPAACSAAAQTAVTTPTVDPVTSPLDASRIDVAPPPTTADWSTVSLTDAPAGYPICSFGYWFVFQHWTAAYNGLNPASHVRTVADYLWVAVSPGAQANLAAHDFAPIPASVVKADQAGLEAMRLY
jgi:ABC-type phosphate transport system substrate-binding protein